MPSRFDAVTAQVGRHLPRAALKGLTHQLLVGHRVALCLHRVARERRPTDVQPQLTIEPDKLDALLGLLLESAPSDAGQGFLSVTFDDGYRDAAEYVASRARRFPQAEFLFFICPEKSERRVGYRWDLAERRPDQREDAPVEIATENERLELRALSSDPAFALADLSLLRELQALPNVELGNHTNGHHKQTRLTDEQAALEYRRSHEVFTRLFGPQRHFAFPFGTPEHEFNARHVAMLRAQGPFLIWTTEARPYAAAERLAGSVLPRFPVDGRRSARELAGWMLGRAALFHARGPKASYPL